MKLEEYLSKNFQLPDEILKDLIGSGKRITLKKGEVLLQPESKSPNVYFIEEGLVKMFYYKDYRSITHYFLLEHNFITRAENFQTINQNINGLDFGIEALEHGTSIFQIPFPKIQKWSQTNVETNRIIQHILLNILLGFSNRLNSIQFENAQDRYLLLLKNNPQIILRAPLGDIASYLGISQQTLSVIRSQSK